MTLIAVAMSWLTTSPSAAQTSGREDAVLIVGAEVPSDEPIDLQALALEVGRAGVRVLPADRARTRFEQRHSSRAPVISASDIDRWLASSRSAVRNLARADYEAARTDLQAAQLLSERALAELNREVARSRQVLDTCLYLARAFLETNDAARAHEQAEICRRLVPRGEPTEFNHTPEVMDLLRRVDLELAASEPATLRVTSTPSGCAVRLNGIEFGRTPLLSEGLRRGDYRVQVECDGETRGRIHRVRLDEGTTALAVDDAFERALAIEEHFRLRYATSAQRDGRVLEDARVVADAAGASEVWVARRSADGGIRLDRIRASRPEHVTSAERTTARDTVAALLTAPTQRVVRDARPASATERARVETPPTETPPAIEPTTSSGSDGTARDAIGVTLLALGLAGDIGTVALYAFRINRGQRFAVAEPSDVDYLDRYQVWLDTRVGLFASAIASTTLITAALPWLLPEHDEVPIWSTLIGIVGIGGVASGIVLEAATARCPETTIDPDQRCIDAELTANLGTTIAIASAPLVAFPLLHIVRALTGSHSSASVDRASLSVSTRSVSLSFEGSF